MAQVQYGELTGTVKDPSGAVIPGAEITITNTRMGYTKTVTTNPAGVYRAGALPIGPYTLRVSSPGFKTSERSGVWLHAGVIARVDFTLEVGMATEVVVVEASEELVNTEDSRPYITVAQHESLPLSARNIYGLIQLAPGALSVAGVSFENGEGAVVNGLRPNFNGFLLNGVANRQLSGGTITLPNSELVAEFQMLTMNMSAQYGNVAGSITNVVTKSGGNDFHGSAYWFIRRDKFDANEFFRNRAGQEKPPLEFDQFGGTATGRIFRDKLFFTGSLQVIDFLTATVPRPVLVEADAWRQAVVAANAGNPSSLAAFYAGNFPSTFSGNPATGAETVDNYVRNGFGGYFGGAGFMAFEPFGNYTCPDSLNLAPFFGATLADPSAPAELAQRFATMFGVTPQEHTYGPDGLPGTADDGLGTGVGQLPGPDGILGTSDDIIPGGLLDSTLAGPNCPSLFGTAGYGVLVGLIDRTTPILEETTTTLPIRSQGDFSDGSEYSFRLDWVREKDRIFGEWYWQRYEDPAAGGGLNRSRGFEVPLNGSSPNLQFSWVHTFGPNVVNELRLGYARNRQGYSVTESSGVPGIAFDDRAVGFGAYSGYPQFFTENIFTYADMVSVTKGSHNLKMGGELRRNREISEFDVGRPSYTFFDQLFFAVDAPYAVFGGVDPGFTDGSLNAQLATNVRDWSNFEMGVFFQDDWKVHPRLTLNLGVRYDLFTSHQERFDRATTFILGPEGGPEASGYSLGQVLNANLPVGDPGCDTPEQIATAILAGVCGPGGFAHTNQLGTSDTNDIGPRLGVAWDLFGNGETVLRAGYGISYQGTLFNPQSNSRWNAPFYSLNLAFTWLLPLFGTDNPIVFGPSELDPVTGLPVSTGEPIRADGDNSNPGAGRQNEGNIMGWFPGTPNQAILTAIVLPQGLKDPWVHNWHVGLQHELLPDTLLEVSYVGTKGSNLYRAENINRVPGSLLPPGTTLEVQSRTLEGLGRPVLNPNYGNLRTWLNVSESWYNGLQASLMRRMRNGLMFGASYTWSHSLDTGSGWHSGAVTANAGAAGDGYPLDPAQPELDKGSSIVDIRHRFVVDWVYELPFAQNSPSGLMRNLVGGWQINGVLFIQSGAHWTPFSSQNALVRCLDPTDATTCSNLRADWNLDGQGNDRPDVNPAVGVDISASDDMWANGWLNSPDSPFDGTLTGPGVTNPIFETPCLGCNGNFPRNSLEGPGQFDVSTALFKTARFGEDMEFQFRLEVFNLFNHTNFLLPNGIGPSRGNQILIGNFGQAGGTFRPRNIQFGFRFLW
jgi:hypothetical protein